MPQEMTTKKLVIGAVAFSLVGIITAYPLQSVLALLGMATDGCNSVDPLSVSLWSLSVSSVLPLVAASVLGVWGAVIAKSKRLLLLFGFLPMLSVAMGVLFAISLSVLGC